MIAFTRSTNSTSRMPAAVKSLRLPQLDQQLRGQGSEPRPTSPEEAAKFMKAEHARWARAIKATGLAPRANP